MIRHEAHVMNVTPEQARQIVADEGFKDQRKRSYEHVAFLREVMVRGEFDSGEPIRFAAYAGRRFLINGQHRMEAIASGGGTQQVVVVTSYCDTAQEAALLYSRIDRGRGRNVADALNAIGLVDGKMSTKNLMAMMSCAPTFAADLRHMGTTGHSYFSKSAEGRASIMEAWKPAAMKYFAAIEGAKFGSERELMKREVVLVGIATFGDLPAAEKAQEFWAGMAADDGLAATDPRKQCLEFMKKGRIKGYRFSQGWLAHGVTACWNAWMRDAALRQVKVMDHRAPLRIAGTRFAKRNEDGSLDLSKPQDAMASGAPSPYFVPQKDEYHNHSF